jgi:Bacteriocin-protection, YdeI or OmpD-Associated
MRRRWPRCHRHQGGADSRRTARRPPQNPAERPRVRPLRSSPQRGDLADDISAALEANPAAAAFFDTLAQFYRKAYLRYIDATTRRPDLRAARIAEVTDLLADGIKERPRS